MRPFQYDYASTGVFRNNGPEMLAEQTRRHGVNPESLAWQQKTRKGGKIWKKGQTNGQEMSADLDPEKFSEYLLWIFAPSEETSKEEDEREGRQTLFHESWTRRRTINF